MVIFAIGLIALVALFVTPVVTDGDTAPDHRLPADNVRAPWVFSSAWCTHSVPDAEPGEDP